MGCHPSLLPCLATNRQAASSRKVAAGVAELPAPPQFRAPFPPDPLDLGGDGGREGNDDNHDGQQGAEHGVLLHGLVEVLVPGGQGEPSLVKLDDVSAGVLVILPDIPDEEATNIIIVLKLLCNCLKRISLKYDDFRFRFKRT